MSAKELNDANAAYCFSVPRQTMVQVLKQCGNDLSRDNVMKQAADLKDLELPPFAAGNEDQHIARPTTARSGRCSWPILMERVGNCSATS